MGGLYEIVSLIILLRRSVHSRRKASETIAVILRDQPAKKIQNKRNPKKVLEEIHNKSKQVGKGAIRLCFRTRLRTLVGRRKFLS
eukprot:2581710-Amphidinium_carterae.1